MIVGLLSLLAFVLGMLHMLGRDFSTGWRYLNIALAIVALPYLLEFLAMRASYRVAERVTADLRLYLVERHAAPRPADPEALRVRRDALLHLARSSESLRIALDNLAADAPAREKYATALDTIERLLGRS